MPIDLSKNNDTIVAQATAIGSAGVGIVRVSGNLVVDIAQALLKKIPKVRVAEYLPFYNIDDTVLDQGIAIYFKAPHSFTGEDVLEFHGHGGQIILDLLIKRILKIKGVRLAKPGEFSERAFFNNKLDLTQAEAIADLINAGSEQAALSAVRSLQGEFSEKIHALVSKVTELRTFVEASIDFSDEDIDFLSEGKIKEQLMELLQKVAEIQNAAMQGAILREGMQIVIAGKPNAGKSSLLNLLAGKDVAIVSSIAGTTRDVLKEHINIDGMPLHIVDTAGLRVSTDDEIEKIGIQRAKDEIKQADLVLLVVDAMEQVLEEIDSLQKDLLGDLSAEIPVTIVYNKMDLSSIQPKTQYISDKPIIYFSTISGLGLAALREHLKKRMGFDNNQGVILARRRHLEALEQATLYLNSANKGFENALMPELIAEDLRMAQISLGEITGSFTSDDLLGKIFSSFCIGK